MSKREWIKKITVIIIGSVIAAYGITLALYAGFGGATLAVLWQGISGTFHVSIGAASFIVAVIMILFVLIYDRSQIHIGTILYQIVYSLCVDLFAQMHVYSKYMCLTICPRIAAETACFATIVSPEVSRSSRLIQRNTKGTPCSLKYHASALPREFSGFPRDG